MCLPLSSNKFHDSTTSYKLQNCIIQLVRVKSICHAVPIEDSSDDVCAQMNSDRFSPYGRTTPTGCDCDMVTFPSKKNDAMWCNLEDPFSPQPKIFIVWILVMPVIAGVWAPVVFSIKTDESKPNQSGGKRFMQYRTCWNNLIQFGANAYLAHGQAD